MSFLWALFVIDESISISGHISNLAGANRDFLPSPKLPLGERLISVGVVRLPEIAQLPDNVAWRTELI